MTVVDSIRHEAISTIHLGEPGMIKPMAIILSPDAKKAYVSTGRGQKVFVIDTVKNEVLTSFQVGQRPWGLALSPDGQTLFAISPQQLYVVSPATMTIRYTIPFLWSGYSQASQIVFRSDGTPIFPTQTGLEILPRQP